MILNIEYYKGDTLLSGKQASAAELRQQLAVIEKIYDKAEDNFVELLCRKYGWTILDTDEPPDCIYDRDTRILIKPRY